MDNVITIFIYGVTVLIIFGVFKLNCMSNLIVFINRIFYIDRFEDLNTEDMSWRVKHIIRSAKFARIFYMFIFISNLIFIISFCKWESLKTFPLVMLGFPLLYRLTMYGQMKWNKLT